MILLLLLGIGSVGIITINSVKRLGRRNRIIVGYFFTQEMNIPALKAAAKQLEPMSASKPEIEELEKVTTEMPTYLDNRDWGMAEFLSSRLDNLVISLADYYKKAD